jgi:hypothetical protein
MKEVAQKSDKSIAEQSERFKVQLRKEKEAWLASEKVRKEKEDEHWRNHDAFTEMIKKAREEKRLADEAKKAALVAA